MTKQTKFNYYFSLNSLYSKYCLSFHLGRSENWLLDTIHYDKLCSNLYYYFNIKVINNGGKSLIIIFCV